MALPLSYTAQAGLPALAQATDGAGRRQGEPGVGGVGPGLPVFPRRCPVSPGVREVLNGIFYLARGGCAWRMMPKDLPIWSTCYDYFRKWRNDGTWSKIDDALRT